MRVNESGEVNLQNIRKTIISIRQSKLPDPAITGNAGSFFMNPVVPESHALSLKNLYPDLPVYPLGKGSFKLAAGWLIEKAGWKGRSIGNCGVHESQALVIVNKGGATGKEILEFSQMIVNKVYVKFGVLLVREVQIV